MCSWRALWSNRTEIPVPERHRTIPNLLNAASMTGLPLLIWGLITSQLWPTVLGMMLIATNCGTSTGWRSSPYDDMVSAHPQLRYRRPDSNEGRFRASARRPHFPASTTKGRSRVETCVLNRSLKTSQ